MPVDEQKTFSISGPILKVAATSDKWIEFWTVDGMNTEPQKVTFQVIGTGHAFDPTEWDYAGTAERTEGGLVWHLFGKLAGGTE